MSELERWYNAIPVVTRVYLTLSFVTAAALSFEFATPFSFYLNFRLIGKGEVWRVMTTFVFFGNFSVNFFFHMHFLYMYSRRLEEHHYHRRTSRFLFLLLCGALTMIAVATFIDMLFLSHSLVMMVVYVWSRRNPDEHLSICGLFTFSAPYLPYLLLGIGSLFGNSPTVDLIGICIGHVFWFLEDVAPRILKRPPESLVPTPGVLKVLFPNEM